MHFIYSAMLASAFMDVAIKMVSPDVPTWTLVTWRWAIAVLFLCPVVVWRFRPGDWRPFDKVHLCRSLLNGFGVFCLFHALQNLPLAVVSTVFFAEPVFTTLFAGVLKQERVTRADWLVSVLGFLGVATVLLGTRQHGALAWAWFDVDAGIAVLGAASFGLATVITRRLAHGHSPLALAFWLAVCSTLIGAPMAGRELLQVSAPDLLLLATAAVLGSAFGLLWVAGLKRIPASTAASARYVTLPLGHLLGYLFFDETPSPSAALGGVMLLVVISGLMRPDVRRRIDAALGR